MTRPESSDKGRENTDAKGGPSDLLNFVCNFNLGFLDWDSGPE